jgi:hypothetical protein
MMMLNAMNDSQVIHDDDDAIISEEQMMIIYLPSTHSKR